MTGPRSAPENRNFWIGVSPQCKRIVVSGLRVHDVTPERERPRQLQPRRGVHGIDEHDAVVIENPLEFAGGFEG